jgi:hypothetical protein
MIGGRYAGNFLRVPPIRRSGLRKISLTFQVYDFTSKAVEPDAGPAVASAEPAA